MRNYKPLMVAVVIGLIALFVSQALAASKWKGVAETHLELAAKERAVGEKHRERADAAEAKARELQEAFDATERVHVKQRVVDAATLARLQEEAEAAAEERNALLASVEGQLSPEVLAVVRPVFEAYETEIGKLEAGNAILTEQRNEERDRADRAIATSMSWMTTAATRNTEIASLRNENASLREAIAAQSKALKPSFGLRLKADIWLAAVGFAAGAYVVGR